MKPRGILRGEKARRRAAKLAVRVAKQTRYVIGKLKRDIAAATAHVESLEAAKAAEQAAPTAETP